MKLFLVRRKILAAFACVLAAAAMFYVVNHPAVGGRIRHHPPAAHLLRTAGSEDDLHLFRRGLG